ncbi:MAG: tetratricopeptide repeat protein [Deltaproteobacteria bacterium]|jgi:tetratricopeptide (TPR) repeat protein
MNVEQLQAAIWTNPDDYASFVALALLHARAGRRQPALMYLREVGHRVPSGAPDHATIGEVYVVLGDPVTAVPHLERAIANAPKRAELRLLFARASLANGRVEEADVALRLAAKFGATATEVRRSIAAGLDPKADPEVARRRLEALRTPERAQTIHSLVSMLEADVEPRASQPDFASDLDWLRVTEALELFSARRSTGRLRVVDSTRRGEVQILEGCVIELRIDGHSTLIDHLAARYGVSPEAGSVESLQSGLLESGQVSLRDLQDDVEAWCARGLAEMSTWAQGRLTFVPEAPGDAVQVVQLDTRRLILAATSIASGTS